ncbi:hypothetical protein ACFV1L_18320 [Kitasatospora sp. NPDC059646]|uniref:hypothetical protein n=1 Tax=Kitasatospora sp. NPDC059646 TaxID=3346893 RepID=UPI0036BC25F4
MTAGFGTASDAAGQVLDHAAWLGRTLGQDVRIRHLECRCVSIGVTYAEGAVSPFDEISAVQQLLDVATTVTATTTAEGTALSAAMHAATCYLLAAPRILAPPKPELPALPRHAGWSLQSGRWRLRDALDDLLLADQMDDAVAAEQIVRRIAAHFHIPMPPPRTPR